MTNNLITLVKYQVNFHKKTWYLHKLKDHCCYGYVLINYCSFCGKKNWNEMVWYFIGVYMTTSQNITCLSTWRCEISPLRGLRLFHSLYVASSIWKCGVRVKGFTDPNTKSANKERMAKFDSHTSIFKCKIANY